MNPLVKQFHPVRISYTSGTPVPKIEPQSSSTDKSNRKCSDESSVLVRRRGRSDREHIFRARVCRPPYDMDGRHVGGLAEFLLLLHLYRLNCEHPNRRIHHAPLRRVHTAITRVQGAPSKPNKCPAFDLNWYTRLKLLPLDSVFAGTQYIWNPVIYEGSGV